MEHREVSKEFHGYYPSPYFVTTDTTLYNLSGLGIKEALNPTHGYDMVTASAGPNTIVVNNVGDLWLIINNPSVSSIEVTGLSFKHTVVFNSKDLFFFLIYSPFSDSHLLYFDYNYDSDFKPICVRCSYYPNHVYFPLRHEPLYSHRFKLNSFVNLSGFTVDFDFDSDDIEGEHGICYRYVSQNLVNNSNGSIWRTSTSGTWNFYIPFDSNYETILFFPYFKAEERIYRGRLYYKPSNEEDEFITTNRVHSNIKWSHYPYPASLHSFELNTQFKPTSLGLKKQSELQALGESLPTHVSDKQFYRYESNSEYQCWFGYAPHSIVPELQYPFADNTFIYYDTDLVLSESGIEFRSPSEVPFVMYNVL